MLAAGYGLSRSSYTRFHCCAHMLPNKCAGIGLPSGTLSLP